ncbi:MAG: hypothetical protein QOG85_776 [Gaiellaceae bacterium]|jgi:hypothetical protein|nr:hypothetical protein [Gaiellaceae bacterium]
MTEDEADEFGRFETLARNVVNTPKPKPRLTGEALGEPADDDPEREDPEQ